VGKKTGVEKMADRGCTGKKAKLQGVMIVLGQ
jgi:hypothetical protein